MGQFILIASLLLAPTTLGVTSFYDLWLRIGELIFAASFHLVSTLLGISVLYYLWFIASRAWNLVVTFSYPTGSPKKIVFIAHSFDEAGYKYSSRLSKLFNLLGFEVLTGEDFSPTSVSRTVRERLRVARLIVAIFSGSEEHTWLLQEAVIESREKPVFVLVEEGLQWKPGIHGDVRYISFPTGNIDDAIIQIMEGLDDQLFIESYKRKTSDAHREIQKERHSPKKFKADY